MGADRERPYGEPASTHEVSRDISNAVAHLYRERLGRGPERARTTIRGDTVLVMIEDGLTRPERLLVEHGRGDDVLRMRRALQVAMKDDFVAAVERATERRVIAFMSDQHVEPDVACEVLVLAPAD